MKLRPSSALLLLSSCLFILALTQDGVYTDAAGSNATLPAWYLFFAGWSAMMAGGGYAWLANPILIFGWILSMSDSKNAGAWAAGIALLIMLAFRLQTKIITGEAPVYAHITGYGAGYWLWLASAVLILLSNIPALMRRPVGRSKAPASN